MEGSTGRSACDHLVGSKGQRRQDLKSERDALVQVPEYVAQTRPPSAAQMMERVIAKLQDVVRGLVGCTSSLVPRT